MMDTMRAAVLVTPKYFDLHNVPIPNIERDDVLIKIIVAVFSGTFISFTDIMLPIFCRLFQDMNSQARNIR